MRIVSTNDFRSKLANYIEDVAKSDNSLIVSRFGKPLVKVVPYKEADKGDFKKFFGFLGKGETGNEFLKRVRRSKKELKYVKNLRYR